MTARPVAFDPRALTDPVDRRAVNAFTAQLRAQGRLPAGAFSGAGAVIAVVGLVIVVGAIAVIGAGVFAVLGSVLDAAGGGLSLLLLVPGLLIVAVVVIVVVAIVRTISGTGARRYRLDRFARANGMTYVPGIPNPTLPGMIFSHGSSRASSDLVRGEQPRFVEIGNYRYTTGSGKNRTTHRWGYVAVKLDVPLPHIVLDAVGNNGLFGASNLPAVFGKDQRLSLEGDFDRWFSLYCPRGYERDALYLFTPDIMARFIDNAAALDVEIVDDWLFLYARRDLSTLDAATWAWVFSIIAALLDKLAQWGRWRDDHGLAAASVDAVSSGIPGASPLAAPPLTPPPLAPAPGVGPQGRRLRRGVPWAALAVIGAVLLVFLIGPLGGLGAILGALFGR
jgi:hypothetical protein